MYCSNQASAVTAWSWWTNLWPMMPRVTFQSVTSMLCWSSDDRGQNWEHRHLWHHWEWANEICKQNLHGWPHPGHPGINRQAWHLLTCSVLRSWCSVSLGDAALHSLHSVSLLLDLWHKQRFLPSPYTVPGGTIWDSCLEHINSLIFFGERLCCFWTRCVCKRVVPTRSKQELIMPSELQRSPHRL